MSRRTLAFVVLLALGLGLLAWREHAREADAVRDLEVPLAPGLADEDVVALRVENVQRDVHMRLERGPDGRWTMTDPLAIAANDALVQQIVRGIVGRTGAPVPNADPAKLGFEPPYAIVELIRRDGTTARVEVGALDLDGSRVHVRVGETIARAYRDLFNALDLDLQEYKTRIVTALEPRGIVEIHRHGRVVLEGASASTDVALDALLDDGVWRATAPLAGTLDPLAMTFLARGAALVEIERYVDEVGRPLAEFGLDPPALSVRLETAHGESSTLRFGLWKERWVGVREGSPYVWSVAPATVWLLSTPVEDLLDPRIVRFERSEIDALDLSSDRAEIRLRRDAFGWLLAEARAGSRVFGPDERAEGRKVDEILGALERVELSTFVREPPFDDREVRGSVRISAQGAIAAGRFGGEHVDAAGLRSLRYQRDGDAFVALVPFDVFEIVRVTAADLVSLELFRVPEVDLKQLWIVGLGRDLRYARDGKGIWRRFGAELEARELRDLLDALVFLRASEHLSSEPRAALSEPIELSWVDHLGARTTIVVAKIEHGGEPRAVAEIGGRRSLLQALGLHARLVQLLNASGG